MSGSKTPPDDIVAPPDLAPRRGRANLGLGQARGPAPTVPVRPAVPPNTPQPQRPAQPAPNLAVQPAPNVPPRGAQIRPEAERARVPAKTVWVNKAANVLGVPLPSSQRRVVDEGLATAAQIAASTTHSPKDKNDAVRQANGLRLAGEPPWNARAAMQATAAKVQLDLLSIPTADRKLVPNGDQSANKTFWLENAGDDGSKSKSFLCKPVSKPGNVNPGGGPSGGEVIREALAGRAAQFFLTQGIDIGMPETHVVKLRPELIGGASDATDDVTCSVQQFGKSVGALGDQSRADLAKIDGKKVASLAVFDAITLNNDRHPGNVLMGADGSLIPIDHGENFSEVSNPVGAARLGVTLAGSSNGLLKIPSAHDPMPPEIAKSVGAFDPAAFADGLRNDRNAIAGVHGDMAGMISDGAIISARRAAEFTKRAANRKPPLSVAAIQVAIGTHVAELVDPALDEGVFSRNADKILLAIAKQQDSIKDVSLTSDADYELLCAEIEKLGWYAQRRGETSDSTNIGDPMTMLAIISGQIRKPAKQGAVKYPPAMQVDAGVKPDEIPSELKADRENYRKAESAKYAGLVAVEMAGLATARDTLASADAARVMVDTRKQATDLMMAFIPAKDRAGMQARRIALDAQPQSDLVVAAYRDLSNEMTDLTLADQKRRFFSIEKTFFLDQFYKHGEFMNMIIPRQYIESFKNITAGNVLKTEPDLVVLEATDFNDQKMIDGIWTNFSKIAKPGKIPQTDPDLIAFLSAIKQRNIGSLIGLYDTIKTRFNN